jgi:hypothetical protein
MKSRSTFELIPSTGLGGLSGTLSPPKLLYVVSRMVELEYWCTYKMTMWQVTGRLRKKRASFHGRL